MNIPPVDQFATIDDVQEFFDNSKEVLLLLDRRGRVHLTNQPLAEMMERPDNDQIMQKTFGEALGCIHIGDHPNGCMYGSICGDCALHVAMKQSLKTRGPVEDEEGMVAIGIPAKGVRRPILKTTVVPWSQKRKMFLIMEVVDTGREYGVDVTGG